MPARAFFIVNPAAARGRAQQYWMAYLPTLQAAFPAMEWAFSSGEDGSGALALEALQAGHRHLVAVGGDGTQQQVLSAIFSNYSSQQLGAWSYALLPLGSGNDWARTHRIPRRLKDWIAMYQAGKLHHQNIGRIRYFSDAGTPALAYFANVAGLAYDAYVVERAEKSKIKNRWLYPLLTLWYLKDFRAPAMQLLYDGQIVQQRYYTINIGIGRYSGGGMRLVPQAIPDGDHFALTYAAALHPLRILLNSFRFYTGGIGKVKGVCTTFAQHIQISVLANAAKGCSAIEADGEWLGYGPFEVELLPLALPFIGPA